MQTSQFTTTYSSSNTSSTLYFFGHVYSGKIRNDWSSSVSVYFDSPPPQLYNSTYIINRNINHSEWNSIYHYITKTSPYTKYSIIRIYVTSCSNLSYPYLMMDVQKCYNQCPSKYYNDSNNRCNLCNRCRNLT